ncbi:MAG: DUF2285 domain-containing protein [Blastomonas fulva]|uniref:DUF2285 domain-containing protein n=1 Tax=Blastomonas fulva TaxID=1550728 RepID=UPI0024E1E5E3|nr:DUF2285 domain-containing protein [Blastomonas fulva]MDK2755828.1 DUF2285 domain-containing protein [Blastomonas fulva]
MDLQRFDSTRAASTAPRLPIYLAFPRRSPPLWLRLCLRHNSGREAPCIVVGQDDLLAVRLHAASRYVRATGRKAGVTPSVGPTDYQRAHLVRLLAIADAIVLGASARDIAFAIVFPRHGPLAGPVWKGSGERRHTLRLIRQARQLTEGGHVSLLRHG